MDRDDFDSIPIAEFRQYWIVFSTTHAVCRTTGKTRRYQIVGDWVRIYY